MHISVFLEHFVDLLEKTVLAKLDFDPEAETIKALNLIRRKTFCLKVLVSLGALRV